MTLLRTIALFLAFITPTTSFALEAKCRGEARLRSLNSDVPTEVRFANQGSSTALIYWINFEGKRVLYQRLPAGSSYTQQTYLTHPWVAISRKGKCLGVFKPKRGLVSVVLQ